ncbi:MAG: trypsin-like serine protease [Actinomycetota bacterium]
MSGRRLAWGVLVMALVAAMAAAVSAEELDDGFAENGVSDLTPAPRSEGLAVAFDSTDRVYVAARCRDAVDEVCILRLTADGTLDDSYGVGGVATVGPSGSQLAPVDIEIDAAGRGLVLAYCTLGEVQDQPCVIRLTVDGTIDATYGDGGVTIVAFEPDGSRDVAERLAVDRSGRALVLSQCQFAFCLAAVRASGEIDASFGTEGFVRIDTDEGVESPAGLAVFEDGDAVIAGVCGRVTCLARVESDGDMDLAFGIGGVSMVDIPEVGWFDQVMGVGITPGGGVAVGGECLASDEFVWIPCVSRFSAVGSLETGFGDGGVARVEIPDSDSSRSATVDFVVDDRGRPLLGGFCSPDNGLEICVWRLTTGGLPDTTWGPNGRLTVDASRNASDSANAIGVDNSGRVVATGNCDVAGPKRTCTVRFASPPVPPGPVGGLDVVALDGAADVSWSPPVESGTDPIDFYTVHAGAGVVPCVTSETSCRLTGLTNGERYSVYVVASSAAGEGESSQPVFVVPIGRPHTPSITAVGTGDGEATIFWSTPQPGDPARPVNGFTATASPGGATCSTVSLTCTISGLDNFVPHTFTVVGHNDIGDGSPSGPFGPVTPGRAPLDVETVSTASTGRVSWEAEPLAPAQFVVEYRTISVGVGDLVPVPDRVNPQIVGGEFPAIEDHRYTAKLIAWRGDDAQECGGSIIDARWVLTAAHCTLFDTGFGFAPADYFSVVYGLSDWTTIDASNRSTNLVFGEPAIIHPEYDPSTNWNDVALIQLETAVDLSRADVIPLHGSADAPHGTDAYVTGWGRTATNGPASDVLKGADVTIDASCGEWPERLRVIEPYPYDPDQFLCASAWPSATCFGDSGGPLVVNEGGVLMVAGIVSFGTEQCAQSPTTPDVYARVSHHVGWIESVTGGLWQRIVVDGEARSTQIAVAAGAPQAVQVRAVNAWGESRPVVVLLGSTPGPDDGATILGPEDTGVDCSVSQPHPMTDVPVTSFGYDSVGCVYQLGITTGTSPTTYSPNDFVTRAQMAAFVERFYEMITGRSCGGSHPFVDVALTSFAYESIGCIFGLGITNGTSATTYSPDAIVSREQMAAFIARLYRLVTEAECGSTPPFGDVAATSFAFLDVGCIASLGVTSGTGPGTYSPSDGVTRIQMAAFLERLYNTLTS